MNLCPCRVFESDVKLSYEECCGPLLSGKKKASSAEALMRSRYVAYVVKNMDYVERTQINSMDDVFNKEEALKWAESSDWNGLEVIRTLKGGESDNSGTVEFVAHYKDKASGTELRHHETSLFSREEGDWKFKEGQIHAGQPVKRLEPKVGRNDPCICGSGKKYKKCCGA
jgi:SEC-C motif domain protein